PLAGAHASAHDASRVLLWAGSLRVTAQSMGQGNSGEARGTCYPFPHCLMMPRMIKPQNHPRYSLIIFDMDGTLTEELLDFPRIRADLNLGPGGILEQLAGMPPDQRQ